MERTIKGLPRQAVSFKEKNDKWKKETVNGIIDQSNFSFSTWSTPWRSLIAKYYEYYNGEVNDEDYTHVTRPYGKAINNMPAKLQNYNILKPTIDVLIGEYSKRPDNYTVVVANPDVNSLREQSKQKLLADNLREHFMLELERLGLLQDSGTEEEPQLPQNLEMEFNRTYKDARAIMGQNILDYLEHVLSMKRNFRKGFFDFVVAGMVYSYKDVVSNEVVYRILNPLDVDYDKSPNIDFIEDADWAIVREMFLPSDVIDNFYDQLTTEQIGRLENPRGATDIPFYYTNRTDNRFEDSRLIEVYRVYWKSIKQIGICHYVDEWGEWQMMEVDENYKKHPGERIDKYWVNEVWEGTRIDEDIFVNVRPFPIQRGSLDNPSKCKLPINGRIYSDRNAHFTSLVAVGIPYQLIYNIYKYRLEIAVAKAKGVIARMDVDYIPPGWDMDKYMYYIDATGIAWEKKAKEGGLPPNNTHRDVLDLSVKAIDEMINLLDFVLNEWNGVSGVSRQRLGAMTQYDGKGVTEQSIIQSSHITEDLFSKFEEFKESERAGLLDLSKLAMLAGSKGMYITPEGGLAYLEVDGFQHMESEYGVFVSNSSKDIAKVNYIKQFAQQMVQAGWSASIIAEMMDSENYSQLKEKIRLAEQAQAQLAQAEQQAMQQQTEMMVQSEQQRMAHEAQQKELDRQNKIEIALIQAESRSNQGFEDPAASSLEETRHQDEVSLKRVELSLKERLERRKLDLIKEKQDKDAQLRQKEIDVKKIQATRPKPSSK